MPKPISPIIPGAAVPEVVFAKDQPQYRPLPAYRAEDGTVLTRWRFTWWERLRVLCSGNCYVWTLTFNQPLQPILLDVKKPKVQ